MTSPPLPSKIEQFRQHAREVREALPDESWANHVYTLAVRILNSTFGSGWVDRHVLASDHQSPFFRNFEAATGDEALHRARVVDLAETIINLQKVPGLINVLLEIMRGHIEDRFAELEVGKMLVLAGSQVEFVKPGGPRGSSYDLEIATPAGKVCADVKCKVESNLTPSGSAILNTLKAARSQLPDDQMGAFFLKLPQSWAPDGDIKPLIPILEQAALDFLRGTKRVVAVIMYFNIVLPLNGGLAVYNVYRQVLNSCHRFGSKEVPVLPLNHEPFMAPRPDWIRLADVCR
jgi:quinol monooxygenase YgiN